MHTKCILLLMEGIRLFWVSEAEDCIYEMTSSRWF